jgi:large subunit ribosomal protein L25
MADSYKLSAQVRERAGKGVARALRREGKIPAVLYGDKQEPITLSVLSGEVTKLYNTGRAMSTLIDLDIDGTNHRAITRDLQFDPVRDTVLHADFLRLGKGSTISVEVQVHFSNEETCPGIRRGGVLNVVRYTVDLICPADSIPEAIEVDLAEADIGDSIHISAINLPNGVVPAISDRDFTIATIAAPAGLKSESGDDEGDGDSDGDDAAEENEG